MKPYKHCLISARRFGGKFEDYEDIHNWFDSTKAHIPDMRHRALLHNAWGIYLCEQIFGRTRTNSDGKVYSVRDVAEQHVIDDLGRIPTLTECMAGLPFEAWFGGPIRGSKKVYNLDDIVD